MNKSINELIEGKTNDPFLLLEDNLFTAALLYNKTYEVQFDDLLHKSLSTSQNRKLSAITFLYKKIDDNKYVIIIYVLQKYILKVTQGIIY
jgi:hypothetical protein